MPENKWWVYQRERFPVFANGALIATFSASAVCFSCLLRGGSVQPFSFIIAFISCFIFFLQLRIADEFKDFEDDSNYRPYRPVPRGLVTLRQLGIAFAIGAAIQAVLAAAHNIYLLIPLAVTWTYLMTMWKEFFVREWLKRRPIVYMVTHMAIMPLVDLYATSCDWLQHQKMPPEGLLWFLMASLFNGMIIEIGRKIRAPEDEEHGVETYSFLWGMSRAVYALWFVMLVTTAFALAAAARIGFLIPVAVIMGLLLICAVVVGLRFLRSPDKSRSRMIENYSGIWTIIMYLSLGVIPWIVRLLAE